MAFHHLSGAAPQGTALDRAFFVRETGVVTDAFEPLVHRPARARAAGDRSRDPRDHRHQHRDADSDERDRRTAPRILTEPVGDEQPGTKADGDLGKCNDPRRREVLSKFL